MAKWAYEADHSSSKMPVWIALATLVMFALFALLIWGWLSHFHGATPRAQFSESGAGAPLLVKAAEPSQYLKDQQRLLTETAWLSARKERARIPVSEAMQLFLAEQSNSPNSAGEIDK